MIKINLAKRKTSNVVRDEGGGGARVSDFMSSDSLKDLPLTQILFVVLAYFGSEYGLNYYKEDVIARLEQDLSQEQSTKNSLENELKSYARLETLRERLEKDERMIQSKILAIKELVGGRSTSVRLISHLSQSLQDSASLSDLWLTAFSLQDDSLKIVGQSYDPNLVSEFIENLKKIPIIQNVSMESLNQIKKNTEEVSEFSLAAMRREAAQ